MDEVKATLVKWWGEYANGVIEECAKQTPYNGTFTQFMRDECIACGGNWGGMLLTGVKHLYPTVWDAIPDHMGANAFLCIIATLMLLGVDTSK